MKTLRDIGPGDEVAIRHPYRPARIAHVKRVTKTQIITSGGDRWRRNDGYMVGGRGFVRLWIEPATDRHRDKVERQRLVDAIEADPAVEADR